MRRRLAVWLLERACALHPPLILELDQAMQLARAVAAAQYAEEVAEMAKSN